MLDKCNNFVCILKFDSLLKPLDDVIHLNPIISYHSFIASYFTKTPYLLSSLGLGIIVNPNNKEWKLVIIPSVCGSPFTHDHTTVD